MYTQITLEERYRIAELRRLKFSIRAIAVELRRAPSSVSREIHRNVRADGGDRAHIAGERTRARRRRRRWGMRVNRRLLREVERLLRLWWSPEQIGGHLKRSGEAISHETIHVHIWRDKRRGGSLWTHLRQAGEKRRKRYGTDRGRHSIVALVVHKTGFLMMGSLERRPASECAAKAVELISRHARPRRHHHADNGSDLDSRRSLAVRVLVPKRLRHGAGKRTQGRSTEQAGQHLSEDEPEGHPEAGSDSDEGAHGRMDLRRRWPISRSHGSPDL